MELSILEKREHIFVQWDTQKEIYESLRIMLYVSSIFTNIRSFWEQKSQNEWEDNSGVEEHVYLIFDVSAVYATIFKRYNKHK